MDSSDWITLLGTILAVLLGVWGTNRYRDLVEKRTEKKEALGTLESLKMEHSTFLPTVNRKKNNAENLSKHEFDGTHYASDAQVIPLRIELPPLMQQTLSNTKLDTKLVGNIQIVNQIIGTINSLIDGVVIERSSGEPAYDKPLGTIALNYHNIGTVMSSIKGQIEEEIDKYS